MGIVEEAEVTPLGYCGRRKLLVLLLAEIVPPPRSGGRLGGAIRDCWDDELDVWLMELKSKPLEIGSSSGELPWEACLHAVLAGSWGLLQPPPMPRMGTGMGASSSSDVRSCEVAWKKGSCQHVLR